MALETWKSPAYTHDGIKFMITTMIWDTKLKKVVDHSVEYLMPKEQIEERIRKFGPVTLYR